MGICSNYVLGDPILLFAIDSYKPGYSLCRNVHHGTGTSREVHCLSCLFGRVLDPEAKVNADAHELIRPGWNSHLLRILLPTNYEKRGNDSGRKFSFHLCHDFLHDRCSARISKIPLFKGSFRRGKNLSSLRC